MGVKTPTKPVEGTPVDGTAKGRVARTKGVSLLPAEYEDAATVEQLTGVGFSEVYRRYFAPQMRAAADLLREAQEAGMELDRGVLRDTWDVHMTSDELASAYTSESELLLGD